MHDKTRVQKLDGWRITRWHFPFRPVGDAPLRFVMYTMPPWPGAHEAERVPDYWPATEIDGDADTSPS